MTTRCGTSPRTAEVVVNREACSKKRMVYWYATWKCNLRCRHCWVSSSPSRSDGELSTKAATAFIARLPADRISHLVLTGGEPLFRPDWPDLIRAVQDAGIRYSVETNATLVDQRFVDLAAEGSRRGLCAGVNTSIDGVDASSHDALRGRGAFGRSVRGVRACVEAGLTTEMQCVISKINYESLPRLGDFADRLGVKVVKVVMVNPVGEGAVNASDLGLGADERMKAFEGLAHLVSHWSGTLCVKFPPAVVPPRFLPVFYERSWPRKAEVLASTSCPFPAVGILPDGALTVCALTRDHEGVSLGQAGHGDPETLLDHPLLRHLDDLSSLEALQGLCGDCVFASLCKGACRAWAFMSGGSFSSEFPICADLAARGEFPGVYRRSTIRRVTRAGDAEAASDSEAVCDRPRKAL